MPGQRPLLTTDSTAPDGPSSRSCLDWIIVGGGPIGVHVAVRLLADGAVSPEKLRIVDPAPELLHRWNRGAKVTGMRFLRSPGVHHLGVPPFDLLQFAGRRKRDRKRRSLFAPPYNRPSVELFGRHSQAVIETHGLADLHIRDRVEHIDLGTRDAKRPVPQHSDPESPRSPRISR